MIVFHEIAWRNFLSTGDKWTKVRLDKHKSTLIVGQNGSGKSTMLDALSFALFGKAHRNISKPQLVNTINNKHCVVQVKFTVNGSQYKVIRGIKPNKFEIWRDGTMINQSSHAKEYQKILEQNIIKLNHKSFHQIVVLGSSSFIPFMQLTAGARRDVIEDLLDINVFSKMNQILKEKNSLLKDSIKDINYQIEIQENRIDTQKKYIADIKKLNKDAKQQLDQQIQNHRTDIINYSRDNDLLQERIDHQNAIHTTQRNNAAAKKQKLLTYQSQFKSDMKAIVQQAKFFENNSSCPTCTQQIDESMRQSKLDEAKVKSKTLSEAMDKLEQQLQQTTDAFDKSEAKLAEIHQWQTQYNNNSQSIAHLEHSILSLQQQIDAMSDNTSDLANANNDLHDMVELKNSLVEQKLNLNEQYTYNQVISEMLKDTGIKTKIVKQYLPVINNLVNQYLQVLDFFVSFHLDEAFSETIKSRHRDAFSYDSFSEGEKQRIDLALLFTWRMIAKMKNSVATNLLVLDETFDSSLDYEGVDNLMKILYTLEDDTNTFVISHKGEILDGKFEDKIEFIKEKNFSKIKGA